LELLSVAITDYFKISNEICRHPAFLDVLTPGDFDEVNTAQFR